MAIYKRGYQRYQGETTSRLTRFLALPRFAWSRLLDQKLILGALISGCFWPLGCAVFIYVANHPELWSTFGAQIGRFLAIDASFFLTFMSVQSTMAVVMAALAGPGLIAPDLSNNALPLYFSRPQSRLDYVLARLVTLLGMIALVTVVPGLFLIIMQTGMAGFEWLGKNWHIAIGVPFGMLIWSLLTSLVALASSAWVKWRVVAGGLIFGFFFVLAGAGELVNAIFRDDSGARASLGWFINPVMLIRRLWIDMLGATENEKIPELLPAMLMLTLMGAALVYILERKLRPVEVIK
jgi:ABC-2 type transport system permease protein